MPPPATPLAHGGLQSFIWSRAQYNKKNVTVSLDEAEFEEIKRRVDWAGLSVANYFRVSVGLMPVVRDTPAADREGARKNSKRVKGKKES